MTTASIVNGLGAYDALIAVKNNVKEQSKQLVERAWEVLLKQQETAMNHFYTVTFNNYGREEMNEAGMTKEDAMQTMRMEIVRAAGNFDLKKIEGLSRTDAISVWNSYVHLCMNGALKRAIEKANETPCHYAECLLRIKKTGLDLYESPDEELIACILSVKPRYKKPVRLLEKMRVHFKNRKHVAAFDEAYSHTLEENMDYQIHLENMRRRLGDLDYKIFYEYYVIGDITLKDIGYRYDVAPWEVRKRLDKAKRVAAFEFGYQMNKADTSYAASHDAEDDIFDGLLEF